ncbi:hypothetical protein ABAC460_01015 [Asticcacaulis sp. AC460]|uniref:hypothetical protein n=1 Tax=Asticcacaulis sp. AC460 TaxID=1282360 RepID=UPI0003C3C2DF|nr:hypothetical protein [Asticcacaulis sp. AC460]ESQ93314.1 hypothetical protein ABAC460_01015 [Asticcacaulis sp. AC460]
MTSYFDISSSDTGLTLHMDIGGLSIMSQILLRAKFPPDYIYTTNELLNPHLNGLIEAVLERWKQLSPRQHESAVFPQSGPFAQAAMKAVDDYIARGDAVPEDREKLLRLAFKPHRVEGFE